MKKLSFVATFFLFFSTPIECMDTVQTKLCIANIEQDAQTPQKIGTPSSQDLLEAARLGDFSAVPTTLEAWNAASFNAHACFAETHPQETDSKLPICMQPDSPYAIPELAHNQSPQGHAVDAGKTLLHYAAQFNHLPTIELLLSAGANPYCMSKNGITPLEMAASLGHAQATRALLSMQGIPQKTPDARLNTLLQSAMEKADETVISLLLLFGADPNNKTTVDAETPLHAAAFFDQPQAIHLLMENGANSLERDKNGQTPLIKACMQSAPCYRAAQELLKYAVVIDTINSTDIQGNTALHGAACTGHSALVQLLIQQGANPSLTNKKEKTPADYAIKNGHESLARLLKMHELKQRDIKKQQKT